MTLALLSMVGVLATGTVTAAPTPSCAEVVLNDWYDGALDGIYDPECYQEALRRLPEDVRVYTTAVDDLSRAMREQLATEGEEADGSSGSARSLSGVRKTQSREKAGTPVAVGQTTDARRPPLPLLLFAAVVLVLAATATGTFVAHRVRRRSSA